MLLSITMTTGLLRTRFAYLMIKKSEASASESSGRNAARIMTQRPQEKDPLRARKEKELERSATTATRSATLPETAAAADVHLVEADPDRHHAVVTRQEDATIHETVTQEDPDHLTDADPDPLSAVRDHRSDALGPPSEDQDRL